MEIFTSYLPHSSRAVRCINPAAAEEGVCLMIACLCSRNKFLFNQAQDAVVCISRLQRLTWMLLFQCVASKLSWRFQSPTVDLISSNGLKLLVNVRKLFLLEM